MSLDNDLLTLWCDAVLLDEAQVRDLIEQVQQGRDDLAAAEEEATKAVEAEVEEQRANYDAVAEERDAAREERDAAVRDLESLQDEARAAMARLQDALGEGPPHPQPATANVTPLRKPRK